jgi:peptide deformylase
MNIVSAPLKILQYPHPSLRHKGVPLTAIDAEVRRVAAEMLALMYENRGLGLAAPQVGLPYRMFVANYKGDPEQPDQQGVFINPVVLEKKGSQEGDEGCLSFPKLFQKIRRARTARVHAYDIQGQPVDLELSGLEARIWQHEVDHLDGVLFIDKMGFVARLASQGTLREFERDYRRAQTRGEIPPDDEIERLLTALEQGA